jgi:DNA-binding response OmpR family regulator
MTRGIDTGRQLATILVVDDREDNRALLVRRLRKAGHAVREAESGAETLRIVEDAPPDLVLLDHNMPGLSGVETVRALRGRFDRSALPVIMVTAQNDEAVVIEALEAGANDFVSKPISYQVLAARIEAQLERQSSARLLAALNEGMETLIEARMAEARAAARTLADARDRAEAAGRARSALIARSVDALRGGVAAAGVAAQAVSEALDQPGLDKAQAALDGLRRALGRLGLAVDGLAEGDGVAPPTPWTEFSLEGLVEDALDHLAAGRPGPGPRIDVSVEGGLGRCRGDRSRLRQALHSLLSNAARFGPAAGPITLAARRQGGGLLIEVGDRGPGVPDELLPLLADAPPVCRTLGPARAGVGAGLGLAVARKALALHGGRLAFRPREGGGLVASLWLPESLFAPAVERGVGVVAGPRAH